MNDTNENSRIQFEEYAIAYLADPKNGATNVKRLENFLNQYPDKERALKTIASLAQEGTDIIAKETDTSSSRKLPFTENRKAISTEAIMDSLHFLGTPATSSEEFLERTMLVRNLNQALITAHNRHKAAAALRKAARRVAADKKRVTRIEKTLEEVQTKQQEQQEGITEEIPRKTPEEQLQLDIAETFAKQNRKKPERELRATEIKQAQDFIVQEEASKEMTTEEYQKYYEIGTIHEKEEEENETALEVEEPNGMYISDSDSEEKTEQELQKPTNSRGIDSFLSRCISSIDSFLSMFICGNDLNIDSEGEENTEQEQLSNTRGVDSFFSTEGLNPNSRTELLRNGMTNNQSTLTPLARNQKSAGDSTRQTTAKKNAAKPSF